MTLAEVQARHGTRLMGLGQAEAARLAMWPPIEIPWQHSGPRPCFSAQFNSTSTEKKKLNYKPRSGFSVLSGSVTELRSGSLLFYI